MSGYTFTRWRIFNYLRWSWTVSVLINAFPTINSLPSELHADAASKTSLTDLHPTSPNHLKHSKIDIHNRRRDERGNPPTKLVRNGAEEILLNRCPRRPRFEETVVHHVEGELLYFFRADEHVFLKSANVVVEGVLLLL